ncbi:MAG: tRNA uridine-5-carboxymethylaminomethyl(34) synthesis GTPase MnmE [Porticoccaceae bacterium]
MTDPDWDIIAAVATPPGRGGVGIVRVSGQSLASFLEQLHPGEVKPRHALLCDFRDADGQVIDRGLLIHFPAPHSFTGEDVIELHGHGGPVVMDALLARMVELGARLARPGEFSQRAFINDKIDLAQAEAIADLIDASSQEAARGAMRSLQGEFSRRIHSLVEGLIDLRIFIEAAIDFPEEEIDFLNDGRVLAGLDTLLADLDTIIADAGQGALIREGMTVVIAGRPNAGKSSLLNALSGRDSAIVTAIAGTTRDVLRESIHIDGMPLHVVDTAGLRDSADPVEQEGIRRAWVEIEQADRILFVVDATRDGHTRLEDLWPAFFERLPGMTQLTIVLNKIDAVDNIPEGNVPGADFAVIPLSAKTGEGVDHLRQHLKDCMGYHGTREGTFIARRRHLDALAKARAAVGQAREQLQTASAGELVAEDLRQAQDALGEITGEFTSDELLGRIFSSFCIGK